MREENSMLVKNELQANAVVARVMRITFAIYTLILVLNVIGIFAVEQRVMFNAYLQGSVFLWCPTIIVNVLKKQAPWVKYVNVICSILFLTNTVAALSYHAVVAYVYGIAISSLYFSKKLNVIATALSLVGVSVGQYLSFVSKAVEDHNFRDTSSLFLFGILPRALVLIAVAAIFTMLCSRTAGMLSNLLGAEEQEKMLNSMKKMQDNAVETSEALYEMVTELSSIMEGSIQANQRIAGEAENLLTGTTENTEAVANADQSIQDITERLIELSNKNHTTAQLTDQIGEKTQENQKRMDDATVSMGQIHSSTTECKQIISNLGEESKEIIGIIQTITSISSRTNILALNAAIEAARAGEHGKGFAVVAEEIQQLSEQTKNAVEDIRTIVHEVVKNTEDAVAAMEQNVIYTQNGMESIQKANETSTEITSSNGELVKQIHEIDMVAQIIHGKSSEVADHMKQISGNTQQNCEAVEHVTAATQENSAGTTSLAEIVEKIREVSEELNNVVQG